MAPAINACPKHLTPSLELFMIFQKDRRGTCGHRGPRSDTACDLDEQSPHMCRGQVVGSFSEAALAWRPFVAGLRSTALRASCANTKVCASRSALRHIWSMVGAKNGVAGSCPTSGPRRLLPQLGERRSVTFSAAALFGCALDGFMSSGGAFAIFRGASMPT